MVDISASATQPVSNQFQLENTRWFLQSLNGHKLLPDTAMTLEFIANSDRVGWFGGCNHGNSIYMLIPENGIIIFLATSTLMGCERLVGDQETDYAATLNRATRYKHEDSTLSFLNKQGKVILVYTLLPKFTPNPENLLGKTWEFVYAPNFEHVKSKDFTLRFENEHYYATTFCTRFDGTFQVTEDKLRFTSTSMYYSFGCNEKALAKETGFTSLLSNIRQYNVSTEILTLYTFENKKITFKSVHQ
jgi:heat shock protein HslJ